MTRNSPAATVTKAVVPAAGLGTRHFPASHAVKKELFPVVGHDGIARALIHHQLIDLIDAGIEEICIIVQPGDEAVMKAYLAGPDDGYLKRLERYPALHAEAMRMRDIARRVCCVVQYEQEGYGHAVYQSKDFAGDGMVLLCLGDHLFRGKPVSPYLELAAMAALSGGRSVSAVNRIGPDELMGYGVIGGVRNEGDPRLIDVHKIIEKPSLVVARNELRVNGLGDDEFMGWFGMHLLAPSIYDILAGMISDNVRDNGEFQLTRAQELQRASEGYFALEMTAAERFDFGVPDDFVRSLDAFRAWRK